MNWGWATVIVVFILIVVGAITLVLIPRPQGSGTVPTTPPKSFTECNKYFGSSNSTPRTCTTNLGQIFTEDIGNSIEMADMIVVASPMPGEKITSPVVITGKARGTYFFEGSFPVEIRSQSGTVIGQGHAESLQPWTVPDFVRFKATIIFDTPAFGSTGTIVLKNDNPSGDPSRDMELYVPITF